MKSERLYRCLLTLLPEDLRAGFGDEMARLFLSRLSEAEGTFAEAWVWLRALSDLSATVLFERRRIHHHSRTRGTTVPALTKDIRYAIRGLRRNPMFAVVSVLTLALGIGASTVAFTLVNGVLVRPLPFAEPDRLVVLTERRANGRELTLSYPNFEDWRAESRSLEGIAAIRFAADATVLGGEEPTRGTILAVSREFFGLLGVQPFLGRPILPEENREGGEAVAVLGYEFWERTFGTGTDLDALDVTISGTAFAVVGVMPRGFKVLEEADVYIPLERNPFRVRSSHNYRAVGRLAPGVTPAKAKVELDGIATRIREAYPDDTETVAVGIRPLRGEILGDVDRPLLLLMGAAGLLLLLACFNVASTLLARSTHRQGEMAIRTAMGAARSRLVRQLFTESLILAGLAGALGLGLSHFALALIRSQGLDLVPRLQAVSMDGTVAAFALGATLVTSVIFGLLPALRVSGDSASTLVPGRGGDAGRTHGVGWSLLVGGEAALTVVLVIACGLLLRSLQEVLAVETNFRADGVLTVTMDLSGYSPEDRPGVLVELKREYEAIPGVDVVGFGSHLPMESTMMTGSALPAPIPEDLGFDNAPPSSGWRVVDEDYFTAMGIALLRGRVFSREDGLDAPPVIILNQALADQAFPGEDPIGRSVRFIPFWTDVDQTVVGVVAEARDWRREPGSQPEGFVYWPQRMDYNTRHLTAVLHTGGDASALVGPARRRLRAVAPTVPGTFRTMQARLGESLRERSFTLTVLGAFAVLSLLLAAVGIYGTVSYSVSRRRREIGIQLALGAATGTVRRRIFTASLGVVALGTGAGVVCAFALGGVMEGLLYGVSSQDPVAFAAAPVVLLAAAALAIGVPVFRYTRVDPAVALQAE